MFNVFYVIRLTALHQHFPTNRGPIIIALIQRNYRWRWYVWSSWIINSKAKQSLRHFETTCPASNTLGYLECQWGEVTWDEFRLHFPAGGSSMKWDVIRKYRSIALIILRMHYFNQISGCLYRFYIQDNLSCANHDAHRECSKNSSVDITLRLWSQHVYTNGFKMRLTFYLDHMSLNCCREIKIWAFFVAVGTYIDPRCITFKRFFLLLSNLRVKT